MERAPEQIAEFSLHMGESPQESGPVALLRVVFNLDYGTRLLAFPLDRVRDFADELTAALKGVIEGNAPRPVNLEARSPTPVILSSEGGKDEAIFAERVTGFLFARMSDGVAIYFEHPGGAYTSVLAQWQQASVLANQARDWHQRQTLELGGELQP